MLTMVVPASPPSCPPMSLAWINTWYSSFTSLSILGKAVFITPGVRARFMSGGGKREGIQSGGKKEKRGSGKERLGHTKRKKLRVIHKASREALNLFQNAQYMASKEAHSSAWSCRGTRPKMEVTLQTGNT